MSQPTPGGPEEAVLQWLGGRAETLEAAFFALVKPVVQSPYFGLVVLAVVVYFILKGKKGKRR